MTDRFNPFALFRAHFSALKDYRKTKGLDVGALVILGAVPLAAALAMYQWGVIRNPSAWFTGITLLATGLIALFVYLADLRLRLAERARGFPTGDRLLRDHLDETGVHALVGAYLGVLTSAVLVVEMNIRDKLDGLMAALPTWSSVYALLLVLMLIPRLHFAFEKSSEALDKG